MMRLEGETIDGRRVAIEGTPSESPRARLSRVWIDGEEATIERVSLLRDGGTTTIRTDLGTIQLFRRIEAEPRDSLDGQALEPIAR